jgi:hypothetical protein
MKDKTYSRSAIVELQEVMLEEWPLRRKSSKMDYGGPHSSRMQRHMIDIAMFFKEWVSHHDEMNCLFIHFELYKHLRIGQLNLLGQSTPQLSIQRLGILLPHLITLHVGMRHQLFRIVQLILLLGSFLKIFSLGLDVLGV